MKLCAFADEASPNLTGQIAALRRNEIPFLEIRGVNGKNIKDVTADEAKEIKKALDAEGISVWSMGSPIGKIALDGDFEAHLDDFKRILESADIFGATHVRMFSFFPVKGMEEEKIKELVFEKTEKLLSVTPDHILLCHEKRSDARHHRSHRCRQNHPHRAPHASV